MGKISKDGIPKIKTWTSLHFSALKHFFTFQGLEHTPEYFSTRIIFALIIFGSVAIFQNFSASYTSFLAVVKEAQPFTSSEDLYLNTEYIIGTPDGWATKDILKVIQLIFNNVRGAVIKKCCHNFRFLAEVWVGSGLGIQLQYFECRMVIKDQFNQNILKFRGKQGSFSRRLK